MGIVGIAFGLACILVLVTASVHYAETKYFGPLVFSFALLLSWLWSQAVQHMFVEPKYYADSYPWIDAILGFILLFWAIERWLCWQKLLGLFLLSQGAWHVWFNSYHDPAYEIQYLYILVNNVLFGAELLTLFIVTFPIGKKESKQELHRLHLDY